MASEIRIVGAKEHNLKDVSLAIPRNRFIVFTGLSGSGKSSLAFDTLYAEAQRRYLESLSAYARQFLEQLKKPDVESIEGLSPSISIEQKNISRNPRSTVGTVTEIYDFLRLLFARTGTPHCPNCNIPIFSQTLDQIADKILSLPENTKFSVLAPIVRGKKGEYQKELSQMRARGFVRAKIDGKDTALTGPIRLEKNVKHEISIYVDRLIQKAGIRDRLIEALQMASEHAGGVVEIELYENPKPQYYSTQFGCPKCGYSFPEIEPRSFSFNSTYGACEKCNGYGTLPTIDPEKFEIYSTTSHSKIAYQDLVYQLKENETFYDDEEWGDLVTYTDCPTCLGARIKRDFLFVYFRDKNISQIAKMNILEARDFFKALTLKPGESEIAGPIVKEISARLDFLNQVGLNYLTLSRSAATLSGGEAQRIRLATQIGASMVGILYILDEPSIGLHQRDNQRLIESMKNLKQNGNTVIVVEHDEETIEACDCVVDLGPGAGKLGGEILFVGSPKDLLKDKKSITGQYLSGKMKIGIPPIRRNTKSLPKLKITNAFGNNLKNLNLEIPLSCFVCVTGVSGSGKSTLVLDTIYPSLMSHLRGSKKYFLCDKIEGFENFDRAIHIDQRPIGRTPRSNPATYTGLFTDIRALFSELPEAKARGYQPGRFSFNVEGGRCETCKGDGSIKVSMHFLPDVYVPCEVCQERRYNRETLEIRYRDKNIADVLEMSIEEAATFFEKIPNIRHKLTILNRVGLGYIHLGQNAVTLSGGEAQRIKLAKELNKKATGKTIYILDEPTTGLHFHDIHKLIEILHELVAQGNTVLVIEHNLDIIKQADYVLDLGPEGGDGGGKIVGSGSPEELSRNESSHTGFYLKKSLNQEIKFSRSTSKQQEL